MAAHVLHATSPQATGQPIEGPPVGRHDVDDCQVPGDAGAVEAGLGRRPERPGSLSTAPAATSTYSVFRYTSKSA